MQGSGPLESISVYVKLIILDTRWFNIVLLSHDVPHNRKSKSLFVDLIKFLFYTCNLSKKK